MVLPDDSTYFTKFITFIGIAEVSISNERVQKVEKETIEKFGKENGDKLIDAFTLLINNGDISRASAIHILEDKNIKILEKFDSPDIIIKSLLHACNIKFFLQEINDDKKIEDLKSFENFLEILQSLSKFFWFRKLSDKHYKDEKRRVITYFFNEDDFNSCSRIKVFFDFLYKTESKTFDEQVKILKKIDSNKLVDIFNNLKFSIYIKNFLKDLNEKRAELFNKLPLIEIIYEINHFNPCYIYDCFKFFFEEFDNDRLEYLVNYDNGQKFLSLLKKSGGWLSCGILDTDHVNFEMFKKLMKLKNIDLIIEFLDSVLLNYEIFWRKLEVLNNASENDIENFDSNIEKNGQNKSANQELIKKLIQYDEEKDTPPPRITRLTFEDYDNISAAYNSGRPW